MPTLRSTTRKRRATQKLGVAVATVLVATVAFTGTASSGGLFGLLHWLLHPLHPTTTTTTSTSTTTSSTTTTSTTTPTTSETTTTTTDPDPSAACAGLEPAKAGGGTWSCTFSDEFDGTGLDRTKWTPQLTEGTAFTGGTDCFVDSPRNIAVSDGSLRLSTLQGDLVSCEITGGLWTSGSVSTFETFSQAYGRYEVRAKFPPVAFQGLHGAIWLWPEDDTQFGAWPRSGEIDVAEVFTRYNDRAIPYVHYVPASGADPVTNNECLLDVTAWNTYLLEWTPTTITISYNGEPCLTHAIDPAAPLTGSQPFDQPFIVSLTMGHGRVGTNNGFVPFFTPPNGTMEVDYVRVWE